MARWICIMRAITIIEEGITQQQIQFLSYIRINILKIFLDGIWGARSKEGIDTSGEAGLAIPDYEKVIQIADTSADKEKVMANQISAYRYMLAYNYNIKKDKDAAQALNDKILALNPNDEQAIATNNVTNLYKIFLPLLLNHG